MHDSSLLTALQAPSSATGATELEALAQVSEARVRTQLCCSTDC